MSHPDYDPVLREDMERLERMLRRLCPTGLKTADAGVINVLDLACGECFEAETLARLLPELANPNTQPSEVEMVGLDIRAPEVARAAERCRGDKSRRFRFLTQNGLSLTRQRGLPEQFDVVFIRHQNYYHGATEWHRLFEQGLEKLAPNGKLIITSYFDREHELAKEAIRRVGGTLLKDLRNEEARALPFPGKFVDKRLALFARDGDAVEGA